MSKLEVIAQALESNPNVVIVNFKEENNFFGGYNVEHMIDYWVAPKDGLYKANQLQKFMMGLIPNLKPDGKRDFEQYRPEALRFGYLFFDEQIGEEKTITRKILTLTDEYLLKPTNEFIDGKKTVDSDHTREVKRRIMVNPFPNEAYAKDLLDNKLEHLSSPNGLISSYNHITLTDLERYKSKQTQKTLLAVGR